MIRKIEKLEKHGKLVEKILDCHVDSEDKDYLFLSKKLAERLTVKSKNGTISAEISIFCGVVIDSKELEAGALKIYRSLQTAFVEYGWIQVMYYDCDNKTFIIIDFEPFWVDYIEGSGLPFNDGSSLN